MRRAALYVLCLVTLSPCHLVTLSPCHAAPPVDTDPNKDYRVTPEAGPWMICAASFTGPNAAAFARQLVLLVRQRDRLPAYYVNRGEQERRQQQEYLNQVRQHSDPDARVRMVRIPDQYAVLIGGYPDMDSARRALTEVKKLKPPEDRKSMDHTIDPQTGRILAINPFAHAFVARNPTVPQGAKPQEKGDDPFLKELNAGEEYSLLRCKKPYTLAVKEYYGVSVTQPRAAGSTFLDKIGFGRKASDSLGAGALQAHELARLLRDHLKLEAYVLHTRRSSVVTVGGFEGPEDPELYRVQRQLASLSLKPAGAAMPAAGKPAAPAQTADPTVLQLFAPAIPMRVPRP